MNNLLLKQISSAREALRLTQSVTTELRKSITSQIEKLAESTYLYDETWGGDWTQNTNVYKRSFKKSNPEWVRVDEDYIKQDLKKRTGIDLDEITNKTPEISKQFFELRDFLISELSFIYDNETFKKEKEILKQIENFKWGMAPGEYTRSRQPEYTFITDPTILNRGLQTPPHIKVGEDIIFSFSLLQSYENFEKLAHRLLRQLEIKTSSDSDSNGNASFQKEPINQIIEKFHVVATQFKNRYNDRPTLQIEDEYDVQDLLNALLRVNYEDIRKEEYTPSYAGGSTRIDFLLKRDKILIEVKKTRPTLKDKEIGNQLIIDIAHYKSHPDCKHLICFVYDPDNLIVNPRGLEDDLNKNTTDDMIVEVLVRP